MCFEEISRLLGCTGRSAAKRYCRLYGAIQEMRFLNIQNVPALDWLRDPEVDPRLTGLLHHPETAADWPEYASRFLNAPFGPDVKTFGLPMLAVGQEDVAKEHWLCWLDLWVFFCLVTKMEMSDAYQGPDGLMRLDTEFKDRRIRFRL
jgi:hypothetical protein